MSIRYGSIIVMLICGGISLAGAQTQTDTQQSSSNGTSNTRSAPAGAVSSMIGVDNQTEDQSSQDLPGIPSMLGGQAPSLAFQSEMERSNYLRGGINVGAGYDDNALLAPSGGVGNTTYSVFPSIAIQQSTSRVRWSLAYGAGLTVNQRFSDRNQGAHNLSFDSQFRLSPHVNLRAAEVFSLTSGIFGSDAGSAFRSGGGVANPTLITPLANRRSSQTTVETNYHLALRDLVGASGSFYDLHYNNVSTGAGSLANTRTASGSAFWLHQLFRRDWAGVSYNFSRITFDPSGGTRVHGIAVMNTLGISKAFTLSAYIGPEYSDNHGIVATGPNAGQVLNFSGWSMAGGVEAGWQQQRTGVTMGYSRRVTDGGGVVGAARLQNVHAAVRRELIPGWAVSAGISYGDNQSLTLISSSNVTAIKSTSVAASLERNIGRSFGLNFTYAHDFQDQSGSADAAQNFNANRNRYAVTLNYQWARALGR